MPKVSIILLARDHLRMTRACLQSVERSTAVPHELILADNGSAAPVRRYLAAQARRKGRRLLRSPVNLPYARIMNRAIRMSQAPYQLWLNNDVLVGPEWLERLIDCLESHCRAGAAGPCTDDRACGGGRGSGHRPRPADLPRFSQAWAMRFDRELEEVSHLTGFCFLVKKEVIERVGLLDERLVWGEEDDDYSFRMRLAGCKMLLARDVFVLHRGHATGEKKGARQSAHRRANAGILRSKWLGEGARIQADLRHQLRRGL